jgi:ubiquinone/menaquinone biosynthesis C-methylase UbiE
MKRLLRFFFHHFYHAFAWTYDLVSAVVSVGRWRDWVLTALPYLDGPRVLEIGHGPGHLQAAMREKGLVAFGLDESRQMGRMAFARLARVGLPVALTRGQAQFLPFGADCFDNVVATFPTEYIFDLRTLEEIYRVLRSPDPKSGRPGGKLVVVPMAWIGGENVQDRAAAWLFRVTHQGSQITEALKDRIKVPFAVAGFAVRVETVEKRSSTVLVVIAEKPVQSESSV